ncbi:MAG: DUF58 domain-containing protein [Bacteriovoracaceae bacterium]|nr:DUF58 domain-containing protein [Bacteriovoracaceae bacterium]
MDIIEVKRVAGRLKSALFKNSNSYSIGMLRSHFKGSGLQFKEHQIYTHGDDVRFIDWKMIAKTNRPYIKTFEEERNVEITVVIDAGITMLSGFEGVSKLQAAIEICCLLYLLAQETGDYVHVIILGKKVTMVPKKNGDGGIISLISSLERAEVIDGNGDVILTSKISKNTMGSKERVAIVMPHLVKRREIVLLSDFNDFLEEDILKKLLYRSNVHCFQVISPLDEAEKIPFSIHSRSADSYKASFAKLNFDGEKTYENTLGKKFKRLRVHERYLEEFIKEML